MNKPSSTLPKNHAIEFRGLKHQQILGLLGALPFICFAFGLPIPFGLSAVESFIKYSAIILAFMAGTLWHRTELGQHVATDIFSNIIAVAAFIFLLLPMLPQLVLAALSLLFLILLVWEWLFFRSVYSIWYWRLRVQLSIVVIFLHLFLFARLAIV